MRNRGREEEAGSRKAGGNEIKEKRRRKETGGQAGARNTNTVCTRNEEHDRARPAAARDEGAVASIRDQRLPDGNSVGH